MIKDNLEKVRQTIPNGTRLIAVSKTKPVEDLQEAYDAGQRLFGENKALEMRDKHDALPHDIEWHFIGHLQKNKIKYIIPFVSLIHSIDSVELLEAVDKEAAKHDRSVDCLLQFHIAQEETKFGMDMAEAENAIVEMRDKGLTHVRIVGVMGMASNTDNRKQVRTEFAMLKGYFDTLKERYFADEAAFCELSMGMSGDYDIAIEEGSTLVRVGSAIFGARNYANVND
ncbi:MAG: YggS family pyridoxal phosphate-dependent enzyme [Bacteroidales bacterium]|nr:YggS family pyridoxal phosphate-dependent enzyme [Bacteroidales bacterium]